MSKSSTSSKTKKGNDIMPAEDLMLLLHNIDLLHKSVQKNNMNSISETDDNNFNTDEISQINNHISISEVQTEFSSSPEKKEKNKKKSIKQNKKEKNKNEQDDFVAAEYITPTFTNDILSYIKIDDEIKNKSDEIKELKEMKKKYENDILNYLNTINQTSINYGEIILRKNEYTSKGSLKNEYIKEIMENEIKDPIKIEKILENLENKKMEAATKRLGLKRTKRNNL